MFIKVKRRAPASLQREFVVVLSWERRREKQGGAEPKKDKAKTAALNGQRPVHRRERAAPSPLSDPGLQLAGSPAAVRASGSGDSAVPSRMKPHAQPARAGTACPNTTPHLSGLLAPPRKGVRSGPGLARTRRRR